MELADKIKIGLAILTKISEYHTPYDSSIINEEDLSKYIDYFEKINNFKWIFRINCYDFELTKDEINQLWPIVRLIIKYIFYRKVWSKYDFIHIFSFYLNIYEPNIHSYVCKSGIMGPLKYDEPKTKILYKSDIVNFHDLCQYISLSIKKPKRTYADVVKGV
jgi:hypothetical protein